MKKWNTFLLTLISAAAGGFGTFFLLDYFALDMGWSTLFWMALYFFASHYAAVIIHEAGHLAGGALKGMKFSSMLVGPILLVKNKGRVSLRWEKHGLSIGGKATMYPDLSERKASLPNQLYWHLLCGPLASLIIGAAALYASITLNVIWLFVFSAISLLAGVINLAARENRDAIPDGAALAHLKDPVKKELLTAAYLIFGSIKDDWSELPAEVADRARRAVHQLPDHLLSAGIASSLAQYDMNRGAPAEAADLLAAIGEHSPEGKRSFVWEQVDANYLMACYLSGRTGDFSSIAARVHKRDALAYEKARYAAAAISGQEQDAAHAYERAIYHSSRMFLIYGDGKLERNLLEQAELYRKEVSA
ncbi:hypothetical protein GKZ89_19060 [Bacillus mangrovi]|uniref:Peptidase M50 domain-containing protein n=1 Tax=Metabacillus mangrovi TaxID=1491830 RepID=A0A7X2S987_9BACI|nr:site-2 protease family protein [Metabacillus mangrovi]MTH55496.1 hypothetical protein [Metabacillus mangrovi]